MSAPPEAVAATPATRSVVALRQRFRQGKAQLLEAFVATRATAPAAARLLRTLARHVDASLADLWQASALPAAAALVAVGGYGRGELFPSSDVDVLILLPEGDESDAT